MANEDCTPAHHVAQRFDSWYLPQSRYPVRQGNRFTPYFCGRTVFAALADSIAAACRSIDIVTWGFDPAMPLRRDHPDYSKSFVKNARGELEAVDINARRKTSQTVYSGWREEDAYGYCLLEALRNHPNLKVRLVIWHTQKNPIVPNLIGLDKWRTLESIARDELSTGFDPVLFGGEQGMVDMLIDKKGLSELLLRTRHPGAQKYSWHWFYHLIWAEEKAAKNAAGHSSVLDRIAVVFRSIDSAPVVDEDHLCGIEKPLFAIGSSDHQKCVLIDIDAIPEDNVTPHAYLLGQNALTEYWSDFPFVHRDPRHEMDRRPFHDFALKIEGPLLVDLSKNFCEAWQLNRTKKLDYRMLTLKDLLQPGDPDAIALDDNGNPLVRPPKRKLLEEDPKVLVKAREAIYPSLEKPLTQGYGATGQIVRTRTDQSCNGHLEKDIKDTYLHAFTRAGNYVFIVNQYCQYERLFRHLKHWWQKRREAGEKGYLYVLMGTCKPESDSAVFRAQQMANELGCGHQFPNAEDELYCAVEPKGGRAQQKAAKPLDDSFVLFAKNSKGLDDALVSEVVVRLSKSKTRSKAGEKMHASAHVSPAELKALHIKPLFFMFHTKIPPPTAAQAKSAPREKRVAQQAYVHAKLCVVDDWFFTLGSANLNIRSMAVDSEMNVISDDVATARTIRDYLFRVYLGLEDDDLPVSERARLQRILGNKDTSLTPLRMEAIYRAFKRIADTNALRLQRGLPIQGCVSRFNDARGVVGAMVTG